MRRSSKYIAPKTAAAPNPNAPIKTLAVRISAKRSELMHGCVGGREEAGGKLRVSLLLEREKKLTQRKSNNHDDRK